MADNVEIQGLEFQIVNDSTQTEQGLEALRNTLGRLRTACGSTATGLSGTAKSVRELKNALQGLNSGDVQQKITRIAGALNALGQVSNVKISSSVANQLTAISGAIDNLKWTDGDKLTALADGLRPLSELGKSNLTTFINQLGKLPTVIEELEKADIDKFTRQMTDLAAAMKPFADEMQKVSNGFSAFPSRIQRLITSTERYNSTVRRATTHTGLFGKALGGLKFAVVWQMARRVGSMLGTVITESNEYQENMNLFTVAMGEYAESALEYGETVSEVLGIDLSDWIRNQGVFDTLLTGFGDTADRAALMSKNLTQLGYDLSSFFNISVEDSMQKLQSGISGELEPLRRLGYDLSQARLEAVALSLGIDKSVSSMTQAEKAELRYYAIMTQVTTAQGDLARTLEAPANQLRILKAQVEMAGRAIGNIFIPALNAILPYGIAVVQIIREIANAIASLFGFQMTEVDYSGITSAGVGAGELADNLDDAAGAAKKLKQYTAGFDELNVFSPDTASGSGVGAGWGSGFEFALPEYDFLGNAVTTRVDEIKKMLENTLADITVMVSGFSLAVGAILVLTGANIPLGLGLMAAGAVGLAATIGLNWNGMSEQLTNTLALITGVVGGFMLALGAIMAFSGANVPLGIALMALGAVSLATAAVVNWHNSDQNITDALTTITGILAGASLAVGAMLALTGVNTPLGIALMAIGAVSIASAMALNWNAMEEAISSPLSRISVIVGTAMLALGAILAFSGGSIPLGITLMALGAVSIASAVALNWNGLSDEVSNTIALITGIVSVALLAVGAVLAFSGANIPLGIALLAGGALMMGTAILPNWSMLSDEVQNTLSIITAVVSVALLAVGAILALSGAGLPLGIGLMAVGAVGLAATAALNWTTVLTKVKETLKNIGIAAGAALLALGLILIVSGIGLPLGIGLLLAGAATLASSVALNWDFFSEKIQYMLDGITTAFKSFVNTGLGVFEGFVNGVIRIINRVISWVNSAVGWLGIEIPFIAEVTIPKLADGGFVDEGQLFIAREAGAEMVGAIGRKTAVANNDQIVEGITAGVTVANDGVIAAIYALLNAVEDKDMSISIGDDVIGRSYDRYNRSRGVRVNNGAFSNAY